MHYLKKPPLCIGWNMGNGTERNGTDWINSDRVGTVRFGSVWSRFFFLFHGCYMQLHHEDQGRVPRDGVWRLNFLFIYSLLFPQAASQHCALTTIPSYPRRRTTLNNPSPTSGYPLRDIPLGKSRKRKGNQGGIKKAKKKKKEWMHRRASANGVFDDIFTSFLLGISAEFFFFFRFLLFLFFSFSLPFVTKVMIMNEILYRN